MILMNLSRVRTVNLIYLMNELVLQWQWKLDNLPKRDWYGFCVQMRYMKTGRETKRNAMISITSIGWCWIYGLNVNDICLVLRIYSQKCLKSIAYHIRGVVHDILLITLFMSTYKSLFSKCKIIEIKRRQKTSYWNALKVLSHVHRFFPASPIPSRDWKNINLKI